MHARGMIPWLRSKTIKMPCSRGCTGERVGGWLGYPAGIRNSDDTIMLTTLPAETIYKSLSGRVTLNYEALYYSGVAKDAKRAES